MVVSNSFHLLYVVRLSDNKVISCASCVSRLPFHGTPSKPIKYPSEQQRKRGGINVIEHCVATEIGRYNPPLLKMNNMHYDHPALTWSSRDEADTEQIPASEVLELLIQFQGTKPA